MNTEITTLHGRDMLRRIKLFETTRINIVHHVVDLAFLKRCRDNQITPSFATINHRLRSRRSTEKIVSNLKKLGNRSSNALKI